MYLLDYTLLYFYLMYVVCMYIQTVGKYPLLLANKLGDRRRPSDPEHDNVLFFFSYFLATCVEYPWNNGTDMMKSGGLVWVWFGKGQKGEKGKKKKKKKKRDANQSEPAQYSAKAINDKKRRPRRKECLLALMRTFICFLISAILWEYGYSNWDWFPAPASPWFPFQVL